MLKSKGVKYFGQFGNSGYAEAAKDYMIGLLDAGIQVSFEPLVLDDTDIKNNNEKRNERINQIVNKDVEFDAIIVHSIPTFWKDIFNKYPNKKKIGMTVWETDKLHKQWIDDINLADEVIVPCEWNKAVFINSGVIKPIHVIPHIYKQQPEIYSNIKGILDKDYVFYTIGQWHNRKGISDTIKAYLNEFNNEDEVVLLIKTFAFSFKDSEKEIIKRYVYEIVESYENPAKIILILDELNQEQIDAIHTRGDCYVSLCKSEGWGLGAFDAAGRGNPVIMTNYGGQLDFLKVGNHMLIDYNLITVEGMPWIWGYESDQKWAQPDITQASKFMRVMYKDRPSQSEEQSKWIYDNFNSEHITNNFLKIIQNKNIIELLRPYDVFSPKKRLGPKSDGGYVISEIALQSCEYLFTYGVENDIRYEEDFVKQFKKPCFLFDHTINKEAWKTTLMTYKPEGLGYEAHCKDFLEHYKEFNIDGDVLLKIDIEGNEWDYFDKTDINEISKVTTGIIIEIHLTGHHSINRFVRLLNTLDQFFILNHIHGNNHSDTFKYGEYEIPLVLELSFINKRYVNNYKLDINKYPIEEYDFPNKEGIEDLNLDFLNRQ